jgi:hypothetical protein
MQSPQESGAAQSRLGTCGTGVICDARPLPSAVIPAKAGIHSASYRKCADEGLDSRLRGNDRCDERIPIPNDASTGTHRAVVNKSEKIAYHGAL